MAAVYKKRPAFANASAGKEEAKTTPVVISDTVMQTSERIEVIEEVAPESKSEAKTPSEAPATDPLSDFKEKMIEEEESPISDTPPKKNYMWPILFIFIIAFLMLGGIFVYKNSTKGSEVNVVTLSPTPTVAPEPTKAVDLSKYEIEILNGSEIDGEAGRQRTNLEEEGFTVASIGNADNSDYTETIIQAKENVDSAFLDKLKTVLESYFTVGKTESLSEDASASIVIILGSKK